MLGTVLQGRQVGQDGAECGKALGGSDVSGEDLTPDLASWDFAGLEESQNTSSATFHHTTESCSSLSPASIALPCRRHHEKGSEGPMANPRLQNTREPPLPALKRKMAAAATAAVVTVVVAAVVMVMMMVVVVVGLVVVITKLIGSTSLTS